MVSLCLCSELFLFCLPAPQCQLTLISRPKSQYADWEDPPQEGEPFDYDALPSRYYFEVESAGSMEPDIIIQEGIKELQHKLAALLHGLGESDGTNNGPGGRGDYDGPRSPDAHMDGGDAGGWQQDGYMTAYGGGGNQSAWGGGGERTPYGQTPYGNSGQGGWNS
jgi:DNA-directed RNA polymerase II subunit RPB3